MVDSDEIEIVFCAFTEDDYANWIKAIRKI